MDTPQLTEAEALAIINRQQDSIFQADMLIRMLLRKLGGRAVLKPHELAAAGDVGVETANDDDGNFIMTLVKVEPAVLQ